MTVRQIVREVGRVILVLLVLIVMPVVVAALIMFFWLVLFAFALRAEPQDAVVRIPSHGASATFIATSPSATYILGCAHAYQGESRNKRMVLDAPHPMPGADPRAGIRVLAVDHQSDLSLCVMATGPVPYVCPVAPPGHRPGRLLSVGHDEMRWPSIQRTATLLGVQGNITYTREKPWHGRSGGGLLDIDSGYLIGVVSGYTEPNMAQRRVEITPGGRGMYVSHAAILRFLGQHAPHLVSGGGQPQGPAPGRPYVEEFREPRQPFAPQPRGVPQGDCPDGRCPLPGRG